MCDLERVLTRARVRMEPEDSKEQEAERARKHRADHLVKVNEHTESLRLQVCSRVNDVCAMLYMYVLAIFVFPLT